MMKGLHFPIKHSNTIPCNWWKIIIQIHRYSDQVNCKPVQLMIRLRVKIVTIKVRLRSSCQAFCLIIVVTILIKTSSRTICLNNLVIVSWTVVKNARTIAWMIRRTLSRWLSTWFTHTSWILSWWQLELSWHHQWIRQVNLVIKN